MKKCFWDLEFEVDRCPKHGGLLADCPLKETAPDDDASVKGWIERLMEKLSK